MIIWSSDQGINWGNANKRDHIDRYQFLSPQPHLVSVSVSSYQRPKSVIVIALTFYLMIIIIIIITPSLCWLNATLLVLLISRCMSSRSVRQSLICLSFSSLCLPLILSSALYRSFSSSTHDDDPKTPQLRRPTIRSASRWGSVGRYRSPG